MTKKLCMIEGKEHEKYFQHKILKHESQIVYGDNNANTTNIFFLTKIKIQSYKN